MKWYTVSGNYAVHTVRERVTSEEITVCELGVSKV